MFSELQSNAVSDSLWFSGPRKGPKPEGGIAPMRYAVWNNKGGVGKSFLSFVLATEIAKTKDVPVLLVDMCPQANLSEIVLGGNGEGAKNLSKLIKERTTIGGYFDTRINSPQKKTGKEKDYLVQAKDKNSNMPDNLYLIVGDPSLELQAQVINQIGSQTLPVDSWKNVHNWVHDLVSACQKKLGKGSVVFIDCNPSFSAYTEVSMAAADALIVPCSSDGSSARAIDNVGALLFGANVNPGYAEVNFSKKAQESGIALPKIHSVILNRSTQYNKKASKAFAAMFDEIKARVKKLKEVRPEQFEEDGPVMVDIPDTHSVAIVCSHLGLPLYELKPGSYEIHDTNPRVNQGPLDRYRLAVRDFMKKL